MCIPNQISKISAFFYSLLFVLLLSPLNIASAQVGRPSTEVEVINTPDVNVVNTPEVTIANTPSVEVTNSPTVQLGAGAEFRDRDNPALQPVQFTCVVTLTDTVGSGDTLCGELPPGKRLVVEYINARARLPASLSQTPSMRVSFTNSDLFSSMSSIEYRFDLQECNNKTGTPDCWFFADSVKFYHTQFNVVLRFFRTIGSGSEAFSGEATLTAHFSGHLVDSF